MLNNNCPPEQAVDASLQQEPLMDTLNIQGGTPLQRESQNDTEVAAKLSEEQLPGDLPMTEEKEVMLQTESTLDLQKPSSIIKQFSLISKKSSQSFRNDGFVHSVQHQRRQRDNQGTSEFKKRKLELMRNADFEPEILSATQRNTQRKKSTQRSNKKSMMQKLEMENEDSIHTIEIMGQSNPKEFLVPFKTKIEFSGDNDKTYQNKKEVDVTSKETQQPFELGSMTQDFDPSLFTSTFAGASQIRQLEYFPVRSRSPVTRYDWPARKVTFDALEFHKAYYNSYYRHTVTQDALTVKKMNVQVKEKKLKVDAQQQIQPAVKFDLVQETQQEASRMTESQFSYLSQLQMQRNLLIENKNIDPQLRKMLQSQEGLNLTEQILIAHQNKSLQKRQKFELVVQDKSLQQQDVEMSSSERRQQRLMVRFEANAANLANILNSSSGEISVRSDAEHQIPAAKMVQMENDIKEKITQYQEAQINLSPERKKSKDIEQVLIRTNGLSSHKNTNTQSILETRGELDLEGQEFILTDMKDIMDTDKKRLIPSPSKRLSGITNVYGQGKAMAIKESAEDSHPAGKRIDLRNDVQTKQDSKEDSNAETYSNTLEMREVNQEFDLKNRRGNAASVMQIRPDQIPEAKYEKQYSENEGPQVATPIIERSKRQDSGIIQDYTNTEELSKQEFKVISETNTKEEASLKPEITQRQPMNTAKVDLIYSGVQTVRPKSSQKNHRTLTTQGKSRSKKEINTYMSITGQQVTFNILEGPPAMNQTFQAAKEGTSSNDDFMKGLETSKNSQSPESKRHADTVLTQEKSLTAIQSNSKSKERRINIAHFMDDNGYPYEQPSSTAAQIISAEIKSQNIPVGSKKDPVISKMSSAAAQYTDQISSRTSVKPLALTKTNRTDDASGPPTDTTRKGPVEIPEELVVATNPNTDQPSRMSGQASIVEMRPPNVIHNYTKQHQLMQPNLLTRMRMSKSRDSLPTLNRPSNGSKQSFENIQSYEFPVIIQSKQISSKEMLTKEREKVSSGCQTRPEEAVDIQTEIEYLTKKAKSKSMARLVKIVGKNNLRGTSNIKDLLNAKRFQKHHDLWNQESRNKKLNGLIPQKHYRTKQALPLNSNLQTFDFGQINQQRKDKQAQLKKAESQQYLEFCKLISTEDTKVSYIKSQMAGLKNVWKPQEIKKEQQPAVVQEKKKNSAIPQVKILSRMGSRGTRANSSGFVRIASSDQFDSTPRQPENFIQGLTTIENKTNMERTPERIYYVNQAVTGQDELTLYQPNSVDTDKHIKLPGIKSSARSKETEPKHQFKVSITQKNKINENKISLESKNQYENMGGIMNYTSLIPTTVKMDKSIPAVSGLNTNFMSQRTDVMIYQRKPNDSIVTDEVNDSKLKENSRTLSDTMQLLKGQNNNEKSEQITAKNSKLEPKIEIPHDDIQVEAYNSQVLTQKPMSTIHSKAEDATPILKSVDHQSSLAQNSKAHLQDMVPIISYDNIEPNLHHNAKRKMNQNVIDNIMKQAHQVQPPKPVIVETKRNYSVGLSGIDGIKKQVIEWKVPSLEEGPTSNSPFEEHIVMDFGSATIYDPTSFNSRVKNTNRDGNIAKVVDLNLQTKTFLSTKRQSQRSVMNSPGPPALGVRYPQKIDQPVSRQGEFQIQMPSNAKTQGIMRHTMLMVSGSQLSKESSDDLANKMRQSRNKAMVTTSSFEKLDFNKTAGAFSSNTDIINTTSKNNLLSQRDKATLNKDDIPLIQVTTESVSSKEENMRKKVPINRQMSAQGGDKTEHNSQKESKQASSIATPLKMSGVLDQTRNTQTQLAQIEQDPYKSLEVPKARKSVHSIDSIIEDQK